MTDVDKIVDRQRREDQERSGEFSLKEKVIYTLGSIVVFGGAFFLGRKLIRQGVSNNEEKKTFEEGSSATYAKQIKMAFDNDGWPGTDTPRLRNVLRQIPTQTEMTKIAQSYQRLYTSSLYKDMQDELQSTEYDEMLSIISGKPERKGQTVTTAKQYEEWAKRLNAAFNVSYGPFPGTDEDAVKAVFNEVPTQAVFIEVAKAYQRIYSRNLLDDIKGELEFYEYVDFMSIITNKPKQ